jgi:alanine dehydrogenase
LYRGRVKTCYSAALNLTEHLPRADLVIGALLVPGKLAPKVLTRAMLRTMRRGSVLVDIAIDQGGVAETSRPTSHSDPIYIDEGVVHYCVPNMPSACARTSTFALTQATLPYVVRLANEGLRALQHDAYFALGLQVHDGAVTHRGLAEDTGRNFQPFR